jgi:hypothetical protein
MAAFEELEADASEWRGIALSLLSSFPSLTLHFFCAGMVDTLTSERRELEDLVRAEHAEKEFFLRKLMEANKDVQTLSTGMEK